LTTVFQIVAGALFTAAVAWALGTIALRKLTLSFHRLEERLLAFLVGSACLSGIVFVLCALKIAFTAVFAVWGALILAYAIYSGAHLPKGDEFPPMRPWWRWLFTVIFAAFTVLYFINALAPEMSPDGMTYHLGLVTKYLRAHGFVRITSDMYANMPQGVEMLFLFAFAFGRHSAAALLHYFYLIDLTLLMICYGQRIGRAGVGAAAATLFYVTPVVGQDASIAYNDIALAAVIFALFYLLHIWDERRDSRLLIPAGLLAGFAFAIKYTAFPAIPYALGFVGWKAWRAGKPFWRPVLQTAALASVLILPWTIKNWLWVNDPVYPFANRLFPNRYAHVSFEDEYRLFQTYYSLTARNQIPLQLTLHGDLLGGLWGPLYFLTPLALLALRYPAGRQLLLAGAIFALPYFANIGARFLIPPAPFLCLALALAFGNVNWLLVTAVITHAALSWPAVAALYSSSGAWRLTRIPLKAALRIEPEDSYLSRNSSEYRIARMLEGTAPPNSKIFAFSPIAESYTSRDVLARYLGAEPEVVSDIVWTPLFADFAADRLIRFQFAPHELRKIRVLQTKSAHNRQWGIAELRVWRGGRELSRSPNWSLNAWPNPWGVQLAFDNTPVTRWRSWQIARPDMYVAVDFGEIQTIDSVTLESADEDNQTRVKLEGADDSGRWVTLSDDPRESQLEIKVNLRSAAASELKARGIRYLLIRESDLHAEDFLQYPSLWGIRAIAAAGGARLYYIQ
jgi:hypothetical protein